MSKLSTLLSDMNSTAKRLARSLNPITELSRDEVEEVYSALDRYSPKTDDGVENRAAALANVSNYIAEKYPAVMDQPVPAEPPAPVSTDGISAAAAAVALSPQAKREEAYNEKVVNQTATLFLSIKQPGFRKKVDSHKVVRTLVPDAHADDDFAVKPETIVVHQDIINRQEIRELSAHRAEMIRFIKELCVPNKYLARGMYCMPLRLTEKIDEKIKTFIQEREVLLDNFEARYEEIKERAKEELGALYDESNYPPFSEIRSKYQVYARYITFNVPEAIESLNERIYQEQLELARKDWEDASQEIRDALRLGFQDLVTHLTDRLGKDESGKDKVFHAKRITKLRDFLETFQDRNITGDEDLAKLVSQARAVIENVDPAKVSKDADLRATLEKSFMEIKKHADSLVVTRGKRAFNLED